GDEQVDRVLLRRARLLAHAVAQGLAAPELALLAGNREVALHAHPQVGVAQAHAVAGRGAVHLRVGAAADLKALAFAHGLFSVERNPASRARRAAAAAFSPNASPAISPLPPNTRRAPASATRRTLLRSPGSKRTAVPLGTSTRKPAAAARSKRSAALT